MGMLVTAAVALSVVAYTYAGYPILVFLASRLFAKTHKTGHETLPMVSVLIPVHNAPDYLIRKLDSLLALDYPKDKLEILICSDGSTDNTDAVLARRAEADARIRPFRSEQRLGKPNALNLMRPHARGDVLLLTDIRQPLSPDALRRLVEPMADARVGAASGELTLEGASGAGVYWRYERWIRKNESRFRSTVGVTGAIYVIRREDFPELPLDLILDDVWIPMRLRLAGKRILFVPGAFAYDEAFADDRELGRKIRTLAGNYQLFAKMPSLLVPFLNPSWFETFSHKVMRLVCPWALLVLLASTTAYALSPPDGAEAWLVYAVRGLWLGQLACYAGAAIGPKAGKLAGVARTFVVLNYAAVAGLWRFLRGEQKIAW